MRNRFLTYSIVALGLMSSAAAGADGTFAPTGDMNDARSQHTATLLRDGTVLVTGGEGLASAELYHPTARKFVRTGTMMSGRRMHSATLLLDGTVLIAGGFGLSTAETYDPATGAFARTGSMLEDQGAHTATLLPDGKVLIAGGQRSAPRYPTAARPEIYDPATGTFSFSSDYAESQYLYWSGGPLWPTANVLSNGDVLITGGNPPLIYDASTNTFSVTAKLMNARYDFGMLWHTGTTLDDGTVLITGGYDDFSCVGFAYAEIYDPASRSFSMVSEMTAPREGHTATRLVDGRVLITGGGTGSCFSSTLASAELFDPLRKSFIAAGTMRRSRVLHTAVRLQDGTILIAGGQSWHPLEIERSAEIYQPAVIVPRSRAVRR